MVKLFFAGYIFIILGVSGSAAYFLFLFLMRRRITNILSDLPKVVDKKVYYPPFFNYSSLVGTGVTGKIGTRNFTLLIKKEDKIVYLVNIFSIKKENDFFLYQKDKFNNKQVTDNLAEVMGPDIETGKNNTILKTKDDNVIKFFQNQTEDYIKSLTDIFSAIIKTDNSILFSKKLEAGKDLIPGGLNSYIDLLEQTLVKLDSEL